MKAIRTALPLIAMLAMTLLTVSAEAQRGGGGWNQGDSLLNLLRSEKVQEELDFVDDQAEQIEELQTEFREEMRYMFEDMRNGGGDRQKMFEDMREKMQDMNTDFNKKAEELLIDDQLARLKQLQNQSRMRGGIERALGNESFREELDISDEQMEDLREAAEEAREWLTEQTAKLRKEAQERVLSKLTQEQQDKIKEMTGEDFEFEQRGRGGDRGGNADQQRGGGQRGGGQRGGGQRGGGQRGGGQRSDF
jgi:hypothetical protein